MGWSLVAVYMVGAVLAFRSAVRYGKTKSDYPYDMSDIHDVTALAALSTLIAVLWPVVWIGAIVLVIVRRIYANTKDGQ